VAGAGFALFRDYLPNDAGDLKVGDCFDRPSEMDHVTDVQHHPCAEAHGAEVVAIVTHPAATGASYPADAAFSAIAVKGCIPAFRAYTGRSLDAALELDVGIFYPTADGWTHGDRHVICYLYRTDKVLFKGSQKAGTL
jgi:putative regulator of septum formation